MPMETPQKLKELGLEYIERLGEGGSAVVYKARYSGEGLEGIPEGTQYIAVKEFKSELLQKSGQQERVTQEIELGKTLSHDAFVRIYDGIPLQSDADAAFLFMELLEGQTLDKWIDGLRANAAWYRLKPICIDIVSALTEIHSRKVFHRDIKPENIMVVSDRAKLMDIGIAEIIDDEDRTLHTEMKDFIGSARYSSPQFIMGEPFTPQDDVYGLGATLLHLLTGQRPYDEVERKSVIPIKVTKAAPVVPELRTSVPEQLRVLVQACLHPSRERRPSLKQIYECIENDGNADFIGQEIQRQQAEKRSFQVIKVDKQGGGFYADMGAHQAVLYEEYTVIRRDDPLKLPSMNQDVIPEKWIAIAELRHINAGCGYFKLKGKRWVETHNPLSTFRKQLMIADGHWQDFDKKTDEVQQGDFVIVKAEG